MIYPVPPQGIRLIATDLDGTLLRHDKTVSPRNAEAIRLAHEAGLLVVAATGRYLASLPILLTPVGVDYAVTSNGAQCYQVSTAKLLFEDTISTATAAQIIAHLVEHFPESRSEVATRDGRTHYAQPGYAELLTEIERRNFPIDYLELTDLAVIREPLIKVTARHPSLRPEVLQESLLASGLTGFHPTTSGGPILEVSGPGITKAHGVAKLAQLLGFGPEQVLAIGDARNDVEMLQWAGVGVAMGNAVPEAIAAADHTTATNEEDGLALAIEALLAA
ncbi:MAG: HAD family hydrolase [Propionibacteriaceae bacterium]|nr:HAD family hydrolase [Propionibacteriaceae bacterium]